MKMRMRRRETEKRTSKICTYVHAKLKSMQVIVYVEHERSNTNDLTVSVKMNVAKQNGKQNKIKEKRTKKKQKPSTTTAKILYK